MNLTFIKLDINILNDTKIKLIRKMPEGNSLFVLWIGILCLEASENKKCGEVVDETLFTADTLAGVLDIPLSTVDMGLTAFARYKMIEFIDDESFYVVPRNRRG